MKKPKNIPLHYSSKGTPIYRDTTGLPFLNGGPFNTAGPTNELAPVMTDAQMKAKMAYEAATGNTAAQRMLSLNPKTYDFGDGNFGTHYMASFGNYAVPILQDTGKPNLEYIENPLPGKEDFKFSTPEQAEYFAENYKTVSPMITQKYLDGGPLVDKTDHGKLLNSVYASALGNYYAQGGMIKRADGSYSQRGLWDNIRANRGSGKEPTKQMLEQERKINREYRNGGQFPTPYSLPEDSFKQGGRNLHNSVYASSMAQYPAVYKYGGSFEMPRQQMYMPLDNVERYGGSILSMSNTPQLEGEGKDLTYPDGAYVYGSGGVVKTSHLFAPGGPINPTTQQSLAQFLNPEFQKIVQGREVTVRPSAYQLQQANRTTNNYDPLLVKNLPSETTQKVAKQSMQAENLNQVAANVERGNVIRNIEEPGYLYKTMSNNQIMRNASDELKAEAQELVDNGSLTNIEDAIRDRLVAKEQMRIDRLKHPLVANPYTGEMVDPRLAASWNNYNDAPAQSVDWVWSLPLGVRALPSALEGLGTIAAKEIPFLGTSVGTAADIYGGVEGTKSLVDAIGAHRQGNTAERNSALLNAGLNLTIPGIQKINAARKPVTALEKRLADQWGTPEWEEATGRTINYPSLKGPTKATKENFSNPMQSDYDKFLKQTTKKLEDDYIKGIPYGTEDELQDKAQDAAVDMLFAKYGKSNVVNWMHNDMYGPLKKYGNFKNFEYKKQAKEIDEYEKGLEKLEKEPLNELITFNSKSNISGIPQTKFSNLEGALKDEFRLNALSDYLPKLGKKKVVPDFTPIPLEPLPKLESFTLPKTGFSDLEKEIHRQADDYVTLATSAKNYERAAALDKEYGTEYVKALDNLAKHKDATAAIGKLPLNVKVVPNEGTGAGGWSTFTPEGRAKLIMYNEGFEAYKPTIFDREIAVVEGNDLSDMARVVPHEIKHHYTLGQDINFYKNQYGEQLSDMLNNPGEISRTNPVLADELIQPAFKDDTRSLFEYFEDPKEIDAYINTNLRDDLVKQKVLKDHWDELTQEKVAEYLMKNPHKYSKKYLDMVKDPEFIKMFNKGVYSIAPIATGAALMDSGNKKEFKMGGQTRVIKSSKLL